MQLNFELLQVILVELGRQDEALITAEKSRKHDLDATDLTLHEVRELAHIHIQEATRTFFNLTEIPKMRQLSIILLLWEFT